MGYSRMAYKKPPFPVWKLFNPLNAPSINERYLVAIKMLGFSFFTPHILILDQNPSNFSYYWISVIDSEDIYVSEAKGTYWMPLTVLPKMPEEYIEEIDEKPIHDYSKRLIRRRLDGEENYSGSKEEDSSAQEGGLVNVSNLREAWRKSGGHKKSTRKKRTDE